MSTLTSRTKQTKPAGTDGVDIAVLNGDFDINDAELGAPVVAISSPLPSVPYDGQLRYDKNDGYLKVYDAALSAWQVLSPNFKPQAQGVGGSWKSVTPTTANVTLGTGSPFNVLDYIRLPGNLIFWKWKLVLGTGGAVTGTISFSLPADAPVDVSSSLGQYLVEDAMGVGRCGLTGGGGSRHSLTASILALGPPATVFFVINDTGNPCNGAGTNPFTWAAASVLLANGFYRTSA